MLTIHVKSASIARSNVWNETMLVTTNSHVSQWVFRLVLEADNETHIVNLPIGDYKTLHDFLKEVTLVDHEVMVDPDIPTTMVYRFIESHYEDNMFNLEFSSDPNVLSNFLNPTQRTIRERYADLDNFEWDSNIGLLSNYDSLRNAIRQLNRSVTQITINNVITTPTDRTVEFTCKSKQTASIKMERKAGDFQCFQSQWMDLTNRRVRFHGNIPTGADVEFVKHDTDWLYFRIIDTDATYFTASSNGNGLLKIEYQNEHFFGTDASYWLTEYFSSTGVKDGLRIANRDAFDRAFNDVRKDWVTSEELKAELPFTLDSECLKLIPSKTVQDDGDYEAQVIVDDAFVPTRQWNSNDYTILQGKDFEIKFSRRSGYGSLRRTGPEAPEAFYIAVTNG